MIWLYIAAPVAGLAYLIFRKDKPKTSIEHLVPKADEHLIPVTPQHQPTVLVDIQTRGFAVSPATTLYRALRDHGQAPPELVAAFQRTHNSDPRAVSLSGPMPVTGIYDPRTSAALTMYTEDPVPAHPSVPDSPVPTSPASILNMAMPGNAALAGSNLYVYLNTHGKDGTQALKDLTLRFQKAVNVDPKFPGPACRNGLPILVPDPLKEDGVAGPKTLRALSVGTPKAIK
jgi:hypothetical protein